MIFLFIYYKNEYNTYYYSSIILRVHLFDRVKGHASLARRHIHEACADGNGEHEEDYGQEWAVAEPGDRNQEQPSTECHDGGDVNARRLEGIDEEVGN